MQRLHTGVYLIGPAPPTPMAKARAAALAVGADAVVSHLSAACLFGLLPQHAGDVDITVTGRNPGRRPGIRRHRVKSLPRHHVTNADGIRVTSIARTICDLAATESAHATEQAFQEALYREIVTVDGAQSRNRPRAASTGCASDPLPHRAIHVSRAPSANAASSS